MGLVVAGILVDPQECVWACAGELAPVMLGKSYTNSPMRVALPKLWCSRWLVAGLLYVGQYCWTSCCAEHSKNCNVYQFGSVCCHTIIWWF